MNMTKNCCEGYLVGTHTCTTVVTCSTEMKEIYVTKSCGISAKLLFCQPVSIIAMKIRCKINAYDRILLLISLLYTPGAANYHSSTSSYLN